jgi:hypothetical protein
MLLIILVFTLSRYDELDMCRASLVSADQSVLSPGLLPEEAPIMVLSIWS